ncbi:MAG: hypothetical protein AVDCRST_MAG02-1336 [uncultured Rubrobacteraceae bacterium]|uniref:Uncharacterized protein n=1 Tax=uncultured Rubrobacteraceae bacterium TaxID=349277 RepID=A0A6J4R349_9ACTN|nr:MAG: hypothetical protein AVDCRST_MAG02-1336 [uncultured Rubrobacteraceae bacterium]
MPPSDKVKLVVLSPAPVCCTERTPSPATTIFRAPPSSLRISHSSPASPGSNTYRSGTLPSISFSSLPTAHVPENPVPGSPPNFSASFLERSSPPPTLSVASFALSFAVVFLARSRAGSPPATASPARATPARATTPPFGSPFASAPGVAGTTRSGGFAFSPALTSATAGTPLPPWKPEQAAARIGTQAAISKSGIPPVLRRPGFLFGPIKVGSSLAGGSRTPPSSGRAHASHRGLLACYPRA